MIHRTLSAALAYGTMAFSATVDVPPSSPAVRILARTYEATPGNVQWSWSGSGAQVAFTGTSCSALLSDPGSIYRVLVDGKEAKTLNLSNNKDTLHVLATGLAAGSHVVEIRVRTEANYSKARFHGFRIDGTPGTAPPASPRRIEFYGNSITCGYGVLDSVNSHPFSVQTEDEGMSFAAQAADLVGAERRTVCWSGRGVIQNYNGDITNPTVPKLHKQILPFDTQHLWDFSRWIPHAVVIDLGTNDFSTVAVDSSKFYRTFLAFVDTLHAHYSAATFFLVDGPMLSNPALAKVKKHLDNLVTAEASKGVSVIHLSLTPQSNALGYGADWHPNRAQATLNGKELAAALRTAMGWTGAPTSLTNSVHDESATLLFLKGGTSIRMASGSEVARARIFDSNGWCLRTLQLAPGSITPLPSFSRTAWLKIESPAGVQVLVIPPRLR